MLPKEVPIRVVTEAPASKVGVRLDLALERVLPLKAVEPYQRTQRYMAGNRSVPNPRRKQYEDRLLGAERTLEEMERKHASSLRDYLRRQTELNTVRQTAERCRERERKLCLEIIQRCGQAIGDMEQPGQVPEECNPAPCAARQCGQEEQILAQNAAVVLQLEKQLDAALEKAEVQRREVQRGRDAFFREPITVEEPMYSDFVYDVELNRLTVKATVTSVLRDLLSAQAPPAPVTQDYDVSHEDSSNKGYDRYGVLADPVQLRSELELRVEVGDKAMADLARRVMERFDAYRQQRVEDARRGMVRPGAEDCTVSFANSVVVPITPISTTGAGAASLRIRRCSLAAPPRPPRPPPSPAPVPTPPPRPAAPAGITTRSMSAAIPASYTCGRSPASSSGTTVGRSMYSG
jgi:hypothetical protein